MHILKEINWSQPSSSNRITVRILGKPDKFNMVSLNDHDLIFLFTGFRLSWFVSADMAGTF